jgi:hypothetical protein
VKVQIHATNRYHPERRMFDSATEAYADWVGEMDWPSVPPAGADWVHCGGWAVETLTKVYWRARGRPHRTPTTSTWTRT